MIKILSKFENEPTFPQLWDICLSRALYNQKDYLKEFRELLKKNNLGKKSKILDTCSGTGFPALSLQNERYSIDCMDGSQDMVDFFNSQSPKKPCKLLNWKNLSAGEVNGPYSLLLCRGNSFIYASGRWNTSEETSLEILNKSKDRYLNVLRKFYSLLEGGGVLYIDKFKDNETPGRTSVGFIQVGNELRRLDFYVKISGEVRDASMRQVKTDGSEMYLNNFTPNLKGNQLEDMLKEVGFKIIKKTNLSSEKHFEVWLAYK